jgi:hypothetical protein
MDFYVLPIEECPEFDGKFQKDKFKLLTQTQGYERRTNIFPTYKTPEEVKTSCDCWGRFVLGEKVVEMSFEMVGGRKPSCNLRVKKSEVSPDELKVIAKYFGVDEAEIMESSV